MDENGTRADYDPEFIRAFWDALAERENKMPFQNLFAPMSLAMEEPSSWMEKS
jgi:hypothetical protein